MYRKFFKRFFDIILSGFAMVILSPLFLILAILVKLNLHGQVIYKQVRPGKNGKLFVLYKFRSMKVINDANGMPLPDEMRRTKFGDALRKTSLDELPQLWNIFKGDMSFVGPRPQAIWNVIYYPEEVKPFSERPGLTGLSQVSGRYSNTWVQMFELDEKYCKKVTLWKDIKILFKTVGILFKQKESESGRAKWYPEELLAKKMISQEDFDKSYILAGKIEKQFLEEKSGYLISYDVGAKRECNCNRHYSKKVG